MFVPEPEAAARIESWAAAVDAGAAAGVWPGWDPSRQAVALHLPASGGWCLAGFPGTPGRRVAARRGGILPGVSYVLEAEGVALGLPGAPVAALRDEEIPGVTARIVLDRTVVVVVVEAAADPAWRTGGRLFAALFRLWWVANGGSPDAPPVPMVSTAETSAVLTVEGRVLLGALRGPDEEAALARAATQVALLRRDRRSGRAEAGIDAERRLEIALGLPSYIGTACAGARGVTEPPAELAEDLGDLGVLSVSRRCLAEGWALALLLDRLHGVHGGGASIDQGPAGQRPWAQRPALPGGWQVALQRGVHVDAVLEAHARFDGGSRDDAAVAAALAAHGYDRALGRARVLAAEAERAREALLGGILQGDGTLLVVDIRGLGEPRVEAPSPAEALHGGLAVYPRGAAFRFGGGIHLRFDPLPVAHDRRNGLLQSRLRAHLRLEGDQTTMGEGDGAIFTAGLDLAAPGVQLHATSGSIQPIDGGYLVRLRP